MVGLVKGAFGASVQPWEAELPSISLIMNVDAAADLHGNVPDTARAALILVDVLNDLDFPQNEYLLTQAPQLSQAIQRLKKRCADVGIPAIYVNDNRGKWRSDIHEVLRSVSRPNAPGSAFVQALVPTAKDYVVLKPKHSAFFATPLEVLLNSLGAKSLIFAGVTANACVLISAGDAYTHGYRIAVPRDCVASLTAKDHGRALLLMEKSFGADTKPSEELDLATLIREP